MIYIKNFKPILFLFIFIIPNFIFSEELNKKNNTLKPKVILIGIDGLSLNMIEKFKGTNSVSHFENLMDKSIYGDLISLWPLRTPQVWTSVVTGKIPSQHGIWDNKSNTYFNPPEFREKKTRLVTAKNRKSKTIWQILDEKNIPTLTVGWMASWPAEQLNHGWVFAPVEVKDKRQTTIKGSFYKNIKNKSKFMPGTVVFDPAEKKLEHEFVKILTDPQDISAKALNKYIQGNVKRLTFPKIQRYLYTLKWSQARANNVESLVHKGMEHSKPELLSMYFQCSDSLLHRFWIFHKSEAEIRARFKQHGLPTKQIKEAKEFLGTIVEGCYQDLNDRLGRILQKYQGENTHVLIVSDHGFGNAPVPHKLKGEPFSGDHLEEGMFIWYNPNMKTSLNCTVDKGKNCGLSVLDIMPLLLNVFKLPYGEDMYLAQKLFRDVLFKNKYWDENHFEILEGYIKSGNKINSYEEKPQENLKYLEGYPKRREPMKLRRDN